MKAQSTIGGLSPELKNEITQIVKSEERFPVDLEKAAEWIGYQRKESAKRTLVNNFIKGVDYSSLRLEAK